jgi:hypothetical protein
VGLSPLVGPTNGLQRPNAMLPLVRGDQLLKLFGQRKAEIEKRFQTDRYFSKPFLVAQHHSQRLGCLLGHDGVLLLDTRRCSLRLGCGGFRLATRPSDHPENRFHDRAIV